MSLEERRHRFSLININSIDFNFISILINRDAELMRVKQKNAEEKQKSGQSSKTK
jgi:hypothetical protein